MYQIICSETHKIICRDVHYIRFDLHMIYTNLIHTICIPLHMIFTTPDLIFHYIWFHCITTHDFIYIWLCYRATYDFWSALHMVFTTYDFSVYIWFSQLLHMIFGLCYIWFSLHMISFSVGTTYDFPDVHMIFPGVHMIFLTYDLLHTICMMYYIWFVNQC